MAPVIVVFLASGPNVASLPNVRVPARIYSWLELVLPKLSPPPPPPVHVAPRVSFAIALSPSAQLLAPFRTIFSLTVAVVSLQDPMCKSAPLLIVVVPPVVPRLVI